MKPIKSHTIQIFSFKNNKEIDSKKPDNYTGLTSAIFASHSLHFFDYSSFFRQKWSLRIRIWNPQEEVKKYHRLLQTIQNQIDPTLYPHIKVCNDQVKVSSYPSHKLANFLTKERRILIKQLSQMRVLDLYKIHFSIFDTPKGFSFLLALVEIEKKIQDMQALPLQEIEKNYDQLPVDQLHSHVFTPRMKQLGDILIHLMEMKYFERIDQLIQDNQGIKTALLTLLFELLLQTSQLENALQIARSLSNTGQKMALLLQMVEIYRKIPSKRVQSEEIFQEAYQDWDKLVPSEQQLLDPFIQNLINY